MRDELRQVENQLVLFEGRLASVRAQGNQRDHLIKALRLWRWDGDSAHDPATRCDLRLDHAWLRVTEDDAPEMELLKPCAGVARVNWYRRADGSIDLGLNSYKLIDLDEFLMDLRDAARKGAPRGELISTLDRVLSRLRSPDLYAVSTAISAKEAATKLADYRNRLQRSEAHELRIRSTVHKGRKPTGARHFADLVRQSF